MGGEPSTSSAVTGAVNTAYGLPAACRRDFTETCANTAGSIPYLAQYAAPAAPKYRGAAGTSPTSPSSRVNASSNRVNALGRSSQCALRAPRCICSNPRASTQSAAPDATAWRARYRAEDPVEQLLFTLITGMPVIPTRYSAFCPLVESPYT